MCQWSNSDPLLSPKEFSLLCGPFNLHNDSHPFLSRLFHTNPVDLDYKDISLLIRLTKGVPNSRSERWIQIKWRLCNFAFHGGPLSGESDLWKNPPRENPPLPLVWDPDLPSKALINKINVFLGFIREAFDLIKSRNNEYPLLATGPYQRRSFLNWAFLVQRALFLICPTCGDKPDPNPSCLTTRFGWALKNLQTKKNVISHVVWYYFLVREIQKLTLYHSEAQNPFAWQFKRCDQILFTSNIPKECLQDMMQDISPITKNPDLVARPLNGSDRTSRRRSRPLCHLCTVQPSKIQRQT